jgi:putative ABC transport system permease protein
MRAWRIAQLALSALRRAPLRVVLTTLGVAIACGAMVTMVAFALGIEQQAETPFRLLDLFKNIQVTPKSREEAKNAPTLNDETLASLEKIPGVEIVYPDIRIKNLTLRLGKKTVNATALAMPREALLFGGTGEVLAAGQFFTNDNGREVLLGQRIVSSLGIASSEAAIGQRVTLEVAGFAPTEKGTFAVQRREIEVVVVGVLDISPLMPKHVQRAVLLPVGLMKEIPRLYDESVLSMLRGGVSAAVTYPAATVRVRDHAELDAVEAQIRRLGFNTRTILSRFQEMQLFFVFFEVLLGSVGAVALLVAALGIVNTLLMSVLERYQEIGIYKALGASDGDLIVMFLTEAGIIGLLGGLGGLALGWGVAWAIGLAVNAYAHTRHVVGQVDLFAFPWWLLGVTLLFSALVSVLAGVYPALRAARIDPIRVLKD